MLGEIDVVGGGAITTSLLYCLARVPALAGALRIIEPDRVDISNLNRYPLMRRSDCGRNKVDVLSKIRTERLVVGGEATRFDAGSAEDIGPLSSRVLVGVDDIPSRWTVQRACDGWLCVAGTSHLYALVTTHPPGGPCAGCVHPRDNDLTGPIPTISFVSFWAGLMQARALLAEAADTRSSPAIHIWPSGLYGRRGLHPTGVAGRTDCPVGCAASRRVA
jgi:molybdopterin/thiamine biosynthesis adenylyltransferase